ncbi:hypothetical protein N9D21_02570 [Candidatus Pelagibacter sp.]|nr:hypothetical protein [Candidatus Pelagibacter sp.]
MSCLIIPNTTSWDSYLSIIKHLKKNKINFKVLIINESMHNLAKKTKWLKDYIVNIEPNYKKIFRENLTSKIIKLIFYHLKYYLFAYNLINKHKFKNIILAGDRDTPLMLILIKLLKNINSKVYIFHSGIFASPKMIRISRQKHKFYFIKKKSFTHKIFKMYCINDENNPKLAILYYDKIQIYLHKIFNILPKTPWVPGGGRSDCYLVENKVIANLYKKIGCKKKIIVIGSKDNDNIIHSIKIKKPRKKITVAIMLTQWFEHNLLDYATHLQRNEILCKNISKLYSKFNLNVVLFLHPKQKLKNYEWVKKYKIKISDKKFSEYFANIDLIYLGFSSSILSWSVQYRKTTIIADIFEEKHSIFFSKSIKYAKNLKQLDLVLEKNLYKIKKSKQKNSKILEKKVYKKLSFKENILKLINSN